MLFIDYCNGLESAQYQYIASNADGLKTYYKLHEDCCYIILCWNGSAMTGLVPEILNRADEKVRNLFHNRGIGTVRILNIIFTGNLNGVRNNVYAEEPVWFADQQSGKLIIYEGQPWDFLDAKPMLESMLESVMFGGNEAGNSRGVNRTDALPRRVNRRIPYANWFFIFANIAVFIWMELRGDTQNTAYLIENGALNVHLIKDGEEVYRLFTSMFMHAGFPHLFNNMLVLWYIGDNLERAVGHTKYFFMYIMGGLLANIAAFLYYDIAAINVCCVGASGAVFSVVGALFYIVMVNKGKLEDLTAFRLGIYIFLSVYLGFSSTGTSNSAHIGGLIGGFILAAIIYRKRKGTSI